MMKIYSHDGSELMQISTLEQDGNDLLIKGMVFGAMPMTARLRPEEARRGLRLLNLRMVMFIISLMYRK